MIENQYEDPRRREPPPEPDIRTSRPLTKADLIYLAGGPPPEKQKVEPE